MVMLLASAVQEDDGRAPGAPARPR